jgi:hypothetical protein
MGLLLQGGSANIADIQFEGGAGNKTVTIPAAGGTVVTGTGNQTIAGTKTFSSSPIVPTPTAEDNSTKVATTQFVGESTQVCKAWVNFNGVPLNGTYSQSGTTITVTMTAHGMTTGMIANLDFTSGTAMDGIDFVVTVTGVNTFTVVGKTSVTTSGNITRNCYIRKSFNVSSIADNGVGSYTVNFTTGMTDSNYSIGGICGISDDVPENTPVVRIKASGIMSLSSFSFFVANNNPSVGGFTDAPNVTINFFR